MVKVIMIRGCFGCLGNHSAGRFSSSSGIAGVIAFHGSSLFDLILFCHIQWQWAVNSEMPPSFKCACSDAQLYRVGLRWLESSRRPAKVDGKTHPSCLWCTLVFLTISSYVFSGKAFCTVAWDLNVDLCLYLQLSITGFLLLACFCLFIKDNYMNFD